MHNLGVFHTRFHSVMNMILEGSSHDLQGLTWEHPKDQETFNQAGYRHA